jgi:hypothetical protein
MATVMELWCDEAIELWKLLWSYRVMDTVIVLSSYRVIELWIQLWSYRVMDTVMELSSYVVMNGKLLLTEINPVAT